MYRNLVLATMGLWLGLASPALAADQTLTFSVPAGASGNPPFVPPAGAPVIGTAQVKDNPNGPDQLIIDISLSPNTRYTVFQGAQGTGQLHSIFLGDFTTDANGSGKFAVTVEIVNQRASTNVDPAFAFAQVQGLLPLAGALANGGFSFRLPFIRIYQANGNATVFGANLVQGDNTILGPSFSTPGGGHVASTNEPIQAPSN